MRRSRLLWASIAAAVLVVALALFSGRRDGAIVPAPLVSHGMVLQRETIVAVTGRARPGARVDVSGSWGDTAATRADERGVWKADLRTREAGGPHRLVVSSGDTETVSDVWVGETWLCSGQSNMAITLRTAHPDRAPETPLGPPIRLFTVPLGVADAPRETCDGRWVRAAPESLSDFSATCWHFGRALHAALNVPIGLVSAAAPGIDIEGWTSARTLLAVPGMAAEAEERRREQTVTIPGGWRPGLFFNAMIAPLAPYTFGGVVWYHGEANVPRAARYADLFPAMIRDWREWFERDLPFGFVQLPGFSGWPRAGELAELRDAQRRTLGVPNTGMVVTLDIADENDIHGTDKAAVGARLADWALARVYGRTDRPASGPLFRAVQLEPDGARVLFDHADDGLVGDMPVAGFEVAGQDRRFHAASATIDGSAVLVRSPDVRQPVAVRYAWSDAPKPWLRNKAGLPASPFRTDEWPGVTEQGSWKTDGP